MITTIRTPTKFSLCDNPIVFTFSGSSIDTVLFKLELVESETNGTVFTGNIYPTPLNPNVASINLTKQLSSLVNPDIDNVDDLVIPKDKNVIGYYLNVSDYGVTSGGTLNQISSGTTTDTFYCFNGGLDVINYAKEYNDYSHVIHSLSTGKFLTNYPNITKGVNDYSTEQLYFIQDGYSELNLVVSINDVNQFIPIVGETIPTGTVPIPETPAFVIITVTGTPSHSFITTVSYIEPTIAHSLCNSVITYTGGTSNYVINLVNQINTNSYGYVATYISGTTFKITTHSGLGSTMNTYPLYYSYWTTGGTNSYTTYLFNGGTNPTTGSTGTTINELHKMYRIQTSPQHLINNGITGLTVGTEYSIKIKDSRDTRTTVDPLLEYIIDVYGNLIPTLLSDIRTYKYEDEQCNIEYVNVLFSNSIGGVDSYQFINPQEQTQVTKQTIKKNNINLNGENVYITNGVYNSVDSVYNTVTKSSIKVYTKYLSDKESDWLTELIKSKNIFIQTNTGDLIPVTLNNNSYNVIHKKYKNNEPIQIQFEFIFPDGFNPALSNNTNSIIINQ